MNTNSGSPDYLAIRITDDEWGAAAMALLVSGGTLTLLGLLPLLGWARVVQLPSVLVVWGLVVACVGGWLRFQASGMVVDPDADVLTWRSPIRERRFFMTEVFATELHLNHRPFGLPGLATVNVEGCDVVLRLRDGTQLTTHHGLAPARALSEAERLAAVTRTVVMRG